MKIKINTRLECAPGAEGLTLVVRRRTRDMVRFQHATGWKMEQLGEEIAAADALSIPVAAFFALSNAGFTPDWDELLDCEPDVFEAVQEPGDERAQVEPDPPQLPADSSPVADGDEPSRPDQA